MTRTITFQNKQQKPSQVPENANCTLNNGIDDIFVASVIPIYFYFLGASIPHLTFGVTVKQPGVTLITVSNYVRYLMV